MIDNLHVSYEKFHKLHEKAKELNMKELSFEFVVGSCFPNVFDNIKKELHIQYTNGYVAGLEEGKKINEEEK